MQPDRRKSTGDVRVGRGRIRTIVRGVALFGALTAVLHSGRVARADPAAKRAREGLKLYQAEKVDEAIAAFEEAAKLDPDSAAHQYNLGTALATKGEHDRAAEALARSAENPGVPSKSYALYNLGYSRVKGAEADEAAAANPQQLAELLRGGLQSFRQALIADPRDADAKHNYELTREMIRQLEEQMQQDQNQQGEGEDQKDQAGGDQQQQEGDQQQKEDGEQSEGKEGEPDSQSEPSNNNSDGDETSDENSDDESGQERGLEGTPTPPPTPSPPTKPPSQSGKTEEPKKAPPPTEAMEDALRVLNSLEDDKPEQFKRLFQFRGGKRRKLEKDW